MENRPMEVSEQNRIRLDKLTALQQAGKNPYAITTYDCTDHSGEIQADFAKYDGKEVSIAGRMMSRRVMGKASFAHLQDRDGRIQIYVRKEDVGEEAYKAFKEDDIGDILGVKGFVFQTKTGETSIHARQITLLTKSVAARYGKDNIRCNSIHPATVDTPFVAALMADPVKKQARLNEIPLGRLTSVEDVANAVLYLASDEASFLNGVNLPIDGGVTCY